MHDRPALSFELRVQHPTLDGWARLHQVLDEATIFSVFGFCIVVEDGSIFGYITFSTPGGVRATQAQRPARLLVSCRGRRV